MGKLQNYDVGGLYVLGNGKPAPADTVLRLDDAEAERLGLKRSADKDAAPAAKPRRASTRKRPAPAADAPKPARAPRKRA